MCFAAALKCSFSCKSRLSWPTNLTENDISADKSALGDKNIVTEEDPFLTATPRKAGMPAEKESHVRKEEEE